MHGNRAFGVSTHLFHNHRLSRQHLLEIGAHGFEAVELFATATHFDYHNPANLGDLQQWLTEGGLELHGVHAPVQPVKTDPVPAVAVSVTTVFSSYVWEQSLPQSMPAGDEATVPSPLDVTDRS